MCMARTSPRIVVRMDPWKTPKSSVDAKILHHLKSIKAHEGPKLRGPDRARFPSLTVSSTIWKP